MGVGVFTKREKILVGWTGFSKIALKGVRTPDIQLRKWYELACRFEAPVIQNLLELHRRFFSILHPQVDEPTNVHKPIGGIASRPRTQLVRSARLQASDTRRRVPPPQFGERPNDRHADRANTPVLAMLLFPSSHALL